MRKYKKIFPAATFFAMVLLTAALLLSCDLFSDFFKTIEDSKKDPYTFYAQNMITNEPYQITAEKLAEGDKCVIWAESGCGVTKEQAKAIADKYDKVIRPRIVDAFSKKQFYDNTAKRTFADILDYANWLTGRNDGKLTILLLDIQDGYAPKTNPGYIAGYFYGGDFYSTKDIYYSNGRDIIYIDTYPGLQDLNGAYSTFAHELQHLINYATARQMGKTQLMDTWIDEGLSSQAEHIYLGGHPTEKCNWFRNDTNGTIAKGNNFFVWDNYPDMDMAILDEYATVYMFFRWLRLQKGNDSIFHDIVTSTGYDLNIIVNLAKKINSDWDTWEKVLRAWMIANYFPANVTYGYKNDSYLQGIVNSRQKFTSGTSILLYPGEGVYSRINNPFTPSANGAGRNIRYVGMNSSSFTLNSPYSGEALLTFNANTTNEPPDGIGIETLQEIGYLTGNTDSTTIAREIAASVQKTVFSGPYVIDARDVLGRERDRELPVFSGPLIQRAEK